MPANVTNALVFIVHSIAQLYLLVLLLRFWLPWLGADFRNPLAQAILRLTSPVVVPLRRIVPPVGRLDTATVLVAFIIEYLVLFILVLITQRTAGLFDLTITAAVNLVLLSIHLFVFAIFVRVILSWVSQGGYNPAIAILHTLTEPVLRPFRRLIPPLGGLDISPVLAIILLLAATMILAGLKRLPF